GSTKREALLTRVLGDKTFADLRFPCAVVTVDLVSGQQVVINEGPLVPALLATTALPGIFPPVVRGTEILVDGGVRNNLPVDVAEGLGAQKVIAVELSDALPGFELPTDLPGNPLARLMLAPRQLAIAHRSLSLLMDQVNQMRLERHPPALHLHPEIKLVDLLDMSRPEVGWAVGEAAAWAVEAELLALKAWRLEGAVDVLAAPVPPAPALEPARPDVPVAEEAPPVLPPAPASPRKPRFALPPDWRLPAFPSRK
ncbi:MAG: patatin-like phospholipase family protein, partial [Chloroflexaceae bacterium]|nr:patatin-like phospholipase family protein [Chloroflexaceae bacterium]